MSTELHRYLAEVILGEREGLGPMFLRLAALPASWLYGAAVSARNASFRLGLRSIHRLPVPIASVGNLTAGGTGKTPFVEWMARRLKTDHGLPVAVVSRGYAATEGLPNDEARVLAENLPDVPHVQDPDRVAASKAAIDRHGARVILLDDGFQHRRLARDLDIVLLDALAPQGSYRLLPRGFLREPLVGLSRADLVVITRTHQASAASLEEARRLAATYAPSSPVVEAAHRVVGGDFAKRRAYVFCGIGQPRSFEMTAQAACGEVVGRRFFPDHHAYLREDVESLAQEALKRGADLLLTTHKDLVKVRHLGPCELPLEGLRIEIEIRKGAEALDVALARLAELTRTKDAGPRPRRSA